MLTPRREIETRLENLRGALRREKAGGYLVSDPADVRYFSGFTGGDSLLLVTGRKQWLLTDSRYLEEGAASAPAFETLQWKKGLAAFTGELARKARLRTLLFRDSHLNVRFFTELKKEARGVKLVPAGAVVLGLRAVKSAWEIERLRAAARVAEAAFRETKKRIRPGVTETEIRLDLEWGMRRRGASDAAFEIIVAADANASLPHAHAGERKAKRGGLVLIDFGARLAGYNSDLTRVVFLDSIPPLWRKRYNLVLAAQQAGLEAISAGVGCAAADAAARRVFEAEGCAEYFGHSLGHGIGLSVHEAPTVGRRAKDLLEPGMVVTVEPGLYYPAQGGIRIEDMALVSEAGAKVLTDLEKDIDSAVI